MSECTHTSLVCGGGSTWKCASCGYVVPTVAFTAVPSDDLAALRTRLTAAESALAVERAASATLRRERDEARSVTAVEMVIRDARREALREAAGVCEAVLMPWGGKVGPGTFHDACTKIRDAILALAAGDAGGEGGERG